jgi:hypothetical protein
MVDENSVIHPTRLGFLLLCILAVGFIFKTGYRLKS